jgi:hypothetical protein
MIDSRLDPIAADLRRLEELWRTQDLLPGLNAKPRKFRSGRRGGRAAMRGLRPGPIEMYTKHLCFMLAGAPCLPTRRKLYFIFRNTNE